jgi:hypothetical protein
MTTWPGALSLATPQHGFEVEPEDRGHGALPDRHRLLHRLAADAQELCRVGDRDHSGRAQRRIFAQRVPGDIGGRVGDAHPLALQHPHHRQADRHQRRLRIGGEPQRLVGALEHHLAELLPQRGVDLVEHRPCLGKGRGKVLAHADRLAALPRKSECPLGHDVRL